MTDSWIGRTIGRYQIESEIGRGGMGVVYRGRQLSLNRPVAIKVLPPQLAVDDLFRRRFRQEAEVIAGLTHENIVHVYDIEEVAGTYCIVMEYVEGQSVRQLRAGGALPPEQVRGIGIAVARALAAAHRRGVVHRDIKSHNVMVTGDGKVKLMDFGIARVAGSGVKTQTGAVLGTPEYMAPEQAREGTATPRTDIYSLGVLLFELATGRLPFSGGDAFSVALKHVSEQAPTPRSLDPSLPVWLEAVIVKAMAKDPAARHASAEEVERELERGDGAEPMPRPAVPVPPPGTEDPTALVDTAASALTTSVPQPAVGAVGAVGGEASGAGTTGSGTSGAGTSESGTSGAIGAAAVGPSATGRTYASWGASRRGWLLAGAVAVSISALLLIFWLAAGGGGENGSPLEPEGPASPGPTQVQIAQLDDDEGAGGEPGGAAAVPGPRGPTAVGGSRPKPGKNGRSSGPAATGGARGGETSGQPALPGAEQRSVRPQGVAAPTRQPPAIEPTQQAPPPPPPPPPPIAETFTCSESVEFHVSPEEALVVIDGRPLGIADDWDGFGGEEWQPGAGSYVACFRLDEHLPACVRVVLDPASDEETCDVDTELEEID